MFRVLRCGAQAAPADVITMLRRAGGGPVAVIFPQGVRPRMAERAALRAMSEQSRANGQRICIIGGDGLMRASALETGFSIATSLEDWLAALAGEGSMGRASSARDAVESRKLVLVGREQDTTADHLYDPLRNDPPDYVVELLAIDGTYAGPRDQDPPTPLHRLDYSEAEGPLHASERYEELLTRRIRRSSGVPMPFGSADPILTIAPSEGERGDSGTY